MLGYGNVIKGYRLYDLAQKRIIHSLIFQLNEATRECNQATPDVADNDYQLIAEIPIYHGSQVLMILIMTSSKILQSYEGQPEN